MTRRRVLVSALPARLVVLVSGAGTNLEALLDSCGQPAFGASVVAVGSDRPGIRALELAESAGVPVFVCPTDAFATRAEWDAELARHCAQYAPDLVVSAGFAKLVGAAFLASFADRFVNTHNALLPAFPGLHAPRDALTYGVKLSGATLFLVDEGVDTGPIIAQIAVPVLDDDSEHTLTERIKHAERTQLVECIGRMVRHGWTVSGRRVTIG